MNELSPLPDPDRKKKLKAQIDTWHNRAEMARQQGRDDLVKSALDRKRQFENKLAQLQEFEVDT